MIRSALLAVLAFSLLFYVSGCFVPDSVQNRASSGTQMSENSVISETDSVAEDSGNPVRSLYKKYSDDTEDRFVLFQDALNGDMSRTCTEASLHLSEHRAILFEGLLTLGWLLPADDGTYASTITGTLAGSGVIAEKSGADQLHYSYVNGKSAAGTLRDSCLTYTCYTPDGNILQQVTVLGNEGAWLSLTEFDGVFTLLCFQSDIRLLTGFCPASVPNPVNSGTTVDQILKDYSSCAQISLFYSEETSSLTREVG